MRNFIFILTIVSFLLSGCTMPTAAGYKELYSFTRQEKKVSGTFGKKKVLIKDFRENEMYYEDMEGLKQEAEEYIARHPNLSEEAKANLRALRVMPGETKEEVRLLLGEPDKTLGRPGKNDYAATQVWVYKISRMRAFNVFIVPVFFFHESYRLYFKEDTVAGIERHFPRQTVEQGAGPGVFEKQEQKKE